MRDQLRRKHTSANARRALRGSPRAVAGIVATVAVGLAGGGCGGGSHTTSTATSAISKAQFIAQANAICTQGNQKSAAAQKALQKVVGNHAPTQAQITAYINGVFVPLIQSQIDQIKALSAPAGEQATVTKTVKSNPAAVARSNSHPFANFAQLAHRYGLTACASKS